MAVRTARQKAALKKAQLASARARKGKGKAKPVARRRVKRVQPAKKRVRRAAPTNRSAVRKRKVSNPTGTKRNVSAKSSAKMANRRKIAKRAAIGAGLVAAAGGAAYTYKNRENLIVQPMAQRRFVKIAERERGRKLTKRERIAVMNREKRQHKNRSNDAVRAYKQAREFAQMANSRGKSLNPVRSNYIFKGVELKHIDDGVKRNGKYGTDSGRFMFELYRKDVNTRARARHSRITGKKSGFGYNSGKQLFVDSKGKVTRGRW